MKFVVLESARNDYQRLSATERRLFDAAIPTFNDACDRYAADPAARWAASLRIKQVEGARGVWELTWSFRGPAGRATFEWTDVDGELALRWRRIGGHTIFKEP